MSMLAGTAVFVNAGTRITADESAGDALSGYCWWLPLQESSLIAKGFVGWSQRRKVYTKMVLEHTAFDRNLVVISCRTGGLVSAYRHCGERKVTLIEATNGR
jgi:hypothetical protein